MYDAQTKGQKDKGNMPYQPFQMAGVIIRERNSVNDKCSLRQISLKYMVNTQY